MRRFRTMAGQLLRATTTIVRVLHECHFSFFLPVTGRAAYFLMNPATKLNSAIIMAATARNIVTLRLL